MSTIDNFFSEVIINVDELWLKGKNRPVYFKYLQESVRKKIKAIYRGKFNLVNQNQRILCEFVGPLVKFDLPLFDSLLHIPGIHSIVPAYKLMRLESWSEDQTVLSVFDKIVDLVSEYKNKSVTFKVNTHRVDKNFKMPSMSFSREVGGRLLKEFSLWKVDVKNPELKIDVRILGQTVYISTQKMYGMGGLPLKSNGKILTLLSGGFDSPVASYLMSKRGCEQAFVFFYAHPFVSEDVRDKIIDLAKVLANYQAGCDLYIVKFGDIQKAIAKTCYEEYRTTLFRSYMIQSGNLLAKKIGAQAILTGDSIGQVSSQTIGNMALLDKVSDLPIFRPLIGYNKSEILELSKKIGTHDISLVPHDDACSMFAPKHPILRPDLNYWQKYHQENDFVDLISRAVEGAELIGLDSVGRTFFQTKT